MTQLVSDEVIDLAFHWLCRQRAHQHFNSDVWHLRYHWRTTKSDIISLLLSGDYHFSPCRSWTVNDQTIGIWSAQDALVLKALSIVLTQELRPQLSDDCYHLKGKGSKLCVREAFQATRDFRYVCRSDVDSYYATIDHRTLLRQLKEWVKEAAIITLFERLLARLDDVNGVLYHVDVGINKGSPLSPLLGAVYLYHMDKVVGDYCRQRDLKYYRFMDDWLVLCHTRYQLREVVRLMSRCLNDVKQTKHPYKTYIGRIKEIGFDFLGYRITPSAKGSLQLAWKTLANHVGKLKQLYEQGATESRIAEYVKRWRRWARNGLTELFEDRYVYVEHKLLKLSGVGRVKNKLGAHS